MGREFNINNKNVYLMTVPGETYADHLDRLNVKYECEDIDSTIFYTDLCDHYSYKYTYEKEGKPRYAYEFTHWYGDDGFSEVIVSWDELNPEELTTCLSEFDK